jgi:hypothetical protein
VVRKKKEGVKRDKDVRTVSGSQDKKGGRRCHLLLSSLFCLLNQAQDDRDEENSICGTDSMQQKMTLFYVQRKPEPHHAIGSPVLLKMMRIHVVLSVHDCVLAITALSTNVATNKSGDICFVLCVQFQKIMS